MSSIDELQKDADELRKFFEQAERQKVKDILSIELRKIETEIIHRQEKNKEENPQEQAEQTVKPVTVTRTATSHRPTTEIRTYGWDQSDNFMKLYVTVKDVQSVPKENVTCDFTDRSFSLLCKEVGNRNYTLKVNSLAEDIIPDQSYFKIKTDKILLMLKKKAPMMTWICVSRADKKPMEDKKKKPDIDENKDPSESLMGMLKQMYDEGDDEMKRTLAKAWTESREKKGAGDML